MQALRQVLRDRKSLLFLLVMPIVFTMFMGFALRPAAPGDPRLPVGGSETLVTIDTPVDQALSYSTADAMGTLMAQNPSIAAALLSIDDASIGVDVADNGRLPVLDLLASGALYGLDGTVGDSWQNLGDSDQI